MSYIVQRGAEAVDSPKGQAQVEALIGFYMENAAIIRRELSAAALWGPHPLGPSQANRGSERHSDHQRRP